MAVKTKQNRCRALRLGGREGGLKEQVAKSGGWRRRRVDVKQAVRLSDGKYR